MTVHCVVGGQYGSEAKGAVTGYLAKNLAGTIINVRVGGPNAGHTAYDDAGTAWALRQVPVGAVTNRDALLIISAGSEIDIEVLVDEVTRLEMAGIPVKPRLFIDEMATIIDPIHKEREAAAGIHHKIGSTAKGIGAARADRIMRRARLARDVRDELSRYGTVIETQRSLMEVERADATIILEGTQGYGLGLSAGHYPHCTSGDCRNIDMLSQTGIVPTRGVHTWIVYRTYPIRVAGNSGYMFGEITWEHLNQITNGYIKPERTTVTKLVRRVATWDPTLARDAMRANGGPSVQIHPCLMFVDYLDPKLAGATSYDDLLQATPEARERMREMAFDIGQGFELFGTGPNSIVNRIPLSDMFRQPTLP